MPAGCGCGRSTTSFKVKLPGGEIKVYSSIIAAKAKVRAVPGAELMNPPSVSV